MGGTRDRAPSAIPTMVLPEFMWVFGRTWVVPKGVPSFVRGGGEVESLPAYTNHGSPARPSLWMLLPLLTSPYKGEGKRGSPYKGEETAWCPHKSLKSPNYLHQNGEVR